MKRFFEWKAVLKGIMCLLILAPAAQALNSDGPGTYQHDAYWSSLDAASQSQRYGQQATVPTSSAVPATAATTAPTTVSPGMNSNGSSYIIQDQGIIYEEADVPDGLFLYNYNQSPQAQAGSMFLGPGSFFVNGYISQGLRYGNGGAYYNPMGMNDKEGYQMDQLYLSFGRKVQRADQFSLGGQIDLMYGSDYYYMSSVGLENRCDNTPHWNGTQTNTKYRSGRSEYGFAMPQVYAEVYAPLMNGLDVKVGHFDSIMGYESLQANRNFFYSQSYSKIYAMPTSMTGVIGTLSLYNGWNLILGGVNEWNAFDCKNDNFSGVVGLSKESYDKFFTFASTVMFGDQTSPCYQPDDTRSDQEKMCCVFNTYGKFRLSDRFNYVIEFTAGYDDREYNYVHGFNMEQRRGRAWFGLTNYLFYQFTDTLAFGTRFEWFNDADSTVLNGGYEYAYQDKAANYFELTFGANWTPVSWLSVRPEIRYDFNDYNAKDYNGNDVKTFKNNTQNNLLTVGCDAIVRF